MVVLNHEKRTSHLHGGKPSVSASRKIVVFGEGCF